MLEDIEETKTSNKTTLIVILCVFVCTLIVKFILSALGFYHVNGQSMYPTFKDGQRIRAEKQITEKDIKYKDILIVKTKQHKKCIKRVVGLPGDIVEIKDSNLYINNEIDSTYEGIQSSKEKWILEENEYFVIGDNFKNSIDSREYGAINFEDIIGIVQE